MKSRRSPLDRREPVHTRILVETDEEPVLLDTIDLGLGGSYCNSKVSLPMGNTYPCKIWLRGVGRKGGVSVEALVLRSELRGDGYRIALRFTRMNRDTRETLKDYLRKKIAEDG